MPAAPRLSDDQLRLHRVTAQHLYRPGRRSVVDLVRHLGGVQAQILSGAGLALRARSAGLDAAAVDRARLADRSIVWTWGMRGTLYFVATEDHGWLLPVVSEPLLETARRRLPALGLRGDLERPAKAIRRVIEREGPLTRAEIEAQLARLEVPSDGYLFSYLVWLASAGGTICFGPDRGREKTYVLARDWVGEPRAMDRDAALAELAGRYLASHGPAEPADLAHWSGLKAADAKRAWAALADRLIEVEAGRRLWMLKSQKAAAAGDLVRLLPALDEYLLGWKDRAFAVAPEPWKVINRPGAVPHAVLLVDGRAQGIWTSERRKERLLIGVETFTKVGARARDALVQEAEDVGRFLGTPAELAVTARKP